MWCDRLKMRNETRPSTLCQSGLDFVASSSLGGPFMLKCFGRESLSWQPWGSSASAADALVVVVVVVVFVAVVSAVAAGVNLMAVTNAKKTPCLLLHQWATPLKTTVTYQSLNLLIALTALDRARQAASSQNRKKQQHKVAGTRNSQHPAVLPFPPLPPPPSSLPPQNVSECVRSTAISPPSPTSPLQEDAHQTA